MSEEKPRQSKGIKYYLKWLIVTGIIIFVLYHVVDMIYFNLTCDEECKNSPKVWCESHLGLLYRGTVMNIQERMSNDEYFGYVKEISERCYNEKIWIDTIKPIGKTSGAFQDRIIEVYNELHRNGSLNIP